MLVSVNSDIGNCPPGNETTATIGGTNRNWYILVIWPMSKKFRPDIKHQGAGRFWKL